MESPSGPRSVLREIGRPQHTGIAADVRNDFALIPDVISGRQNIHAAFVEFTAKPLGQPETACRILSVYDDEVDVEFPP